MIFNSSLFRIKPTFLIPIKLITIAIAIKSFFTFHRDFGYISSMKNIIYSIVLLCSLFCAAPSYSLDLNKGWVATAQYNLGLMYDNGQGVLQDYKNAAKWYKLAAEQGYASAQYNLGVIYEKGDGLVQDYKTAVKWYKLAAEQGDTPAQYNLGLMYAKGHGVIQDNIYAHMWWNISASNGHRNAVKNRDIIMKRMTTADISTAQKLARECVRKKYKGC